MDDYVEELQTDRRTAVWQARLSTGEVVTMDDNRPGVEPASAWVRLGDRCRRDGVSVTGLWLKFRSNVERNILPADADGYFFSKSVLGMLNSTETIQFYLVGALHQGQLLVQRWQVPELILVEVEERDAGYSGPCLIRSTHGDTTGLGQGPD